MSYHGKLIGPNGQVYQCEHNHRTLTAAVTCANSSATRRMAEMAWNRAAAQAAQRAALARRRAEERAAAEVSRKAAQEAAAARRVAAQAAAEEAKAAKRAAKLAAMPPRRAWKKMTQEERLLKIAQAELGVYGEVVSPEAKAAHDKRAAKRPIANASASSRFYDAVNAKDIPGTHIVKPGSGYKGLTLCGALAGRYASANHPSDVSCGECRRRWQLAMAGEAVPPSPQRQQQPAASAWPASEPAPAGAMVQPTARAAADVPAYMRALDLSLSPRERALAKEQAARDPEQWQKYVTALRAQKAYYEVPKQTGTNAGNSLPVDGAPSVTPAASRARALPPEYVPPPAPALPQSRRTAAASAHNVSRARPTTAGPPRSSGADARRPEDTAAGNPPAGPSEGFGGDGLFVVGLDITPGVYRSARQASERSGSVALMKSTSMRDVVDFSTVKGPITITVGPGIRAVKVSGCQPWQRLGDSLDEIIAAARKPSDTAGRD